MSISTSYSDLILKAEVVVRRYCEHFSVSDPLERADIITRVILMFEKGMLDDVDMMANLLESRGI